MPTPFSQPKAGWVRETRERARGAEGQGLGFRV